MDRQIYNRMREIERAHWWFAARREIIADQLEALKLPADARILEVGCGTGGNLEMLGRFGQVSAVEPDEESIRYAGERTAVKVLPGFLPDGLPSFEEQFDLVAAFDVIEHVNDDGASVQALANLLRPGGRFIATVPAYQWMWSRHDELHHHKRRYGLQAFRRLFDDAGLRVRKATHFNALLFPLIGGVRIAKNLARIDNGEDDAMPSALVNGMLHRLFGSEKGILRHADLPFGVSILLIAERPAEA
jgi:SAM-dependent methyltransferase